MSSPVLTTETSCPKCGSQAQGAKCRMCGFDILNDTLVSIQNAPKADLHNMNYSEWLRGKNIHIWIKDKR